MECSPFIYYLVFLVDDARLFLPSVTFRPTPRGFYNFQSSPGSVKLKMVLRYYIFPFNVAFVINFVLALHFPFLPRPWGNISRLLRVRARPLNHLNILMEKVPVSRFSKYAHNSLVRSEIYISSRYGSRSSIITLLQLWNRKTPCNWIASFFSRHEL